MIDITKSLIRASKQVASLNGRVYRRYPILTPTAPFMVLSPAGRSVIMIDDDGSELIVNLVYSVEILDTDEERLDGIVESINNVFNSRTTLCTSRTQEYDKETELYTASLVYAVTVDKRGSTYKT